MGDVDTVPTTSLPVARDAQATGEKRETDDGNAPISPTLLYGLPIRTAA